jgi:hypothetical protein
MRPGIAVLVAIVVLPMLAYSQYMTPGERKMLREAQLRAAEERGEIVAGMTKDSVIRVLGQPDTVNAFESGGARAEQWVYRRKEPRCTGTFDGRNIYVHLRADIVTSTSTDLRCSKPAR